MIEICKKILDLIMIMVNKFFFLKIDLTDTLDVYLGVLIIGFLFIVLLIYFIFKALGIIGGDD